MGFARTISKGVSLVSLAALTGLAVPSAAAQYTGSPAGRFDAAGGASASATVGPFALQASFAPSVLARAPYPDQDRSGVGIRLANESTMFSVGFVPADSPAPGDSTARGAAAALALAVGPSFRPATFGTETWVSPLIPVVLEIGYQYLEPTQPATLTPGAEGPEAFSLGRFGLGAGLGVEVGHVVVGGPVAEVVGLASFVVAPGVLTEFDEGAFSPGYSQRTVSFDIEVRVSELGGSAVGVALGYSRRATRWDPAGLDSASGLSAGLVADGYVEQSRTSMVHLGLTF